MRAALAWTVAREQTVLAQRLAGALWPYWRRHADYTEARLWLDRALSLPAPAEAARGQRPTTAGATSDRSARRKALWGDAWLSYYQGDYAHVRRPGEDLLRLAEHDDDRVGIRNGLTIGALVAMAEQRFDAAIRPLEESLRICRSSCPPWLLATPLLVRGQASLHGPDLVRARALLEEALSLYRRLGDRLFIARTKGYLGSMSLCWGPTRPRADGCSARASGGSWTLANDSESPRSSRPWRP